jgi:hypothetical protein
VEKEHLAQVLIVRIHDDIKSSPLLFVEKSKTMSDSSSKDILVIIELLMEDEVGSGLTPVPERGERHMGIVRQALSSLDELLIEKVKSIVIDEIRRRGRVIWVELRDPVGEVITYAVLEEMPEFNRRSGIAMVEDGCKEGTELMACLHVSCLLETLLPLLIVLQEAPCQASIFECGMENAIDGTQVFKGSGALYNSEEGPEVETLSRGRRSKMHAADGKTPLPWFPLLGLLVIDPGLRKVLVGGLPGSLMDTVGFEPSSQVGLLG